MLRLAHPETNMASTQDWLRASKDMTISAYDSMTQSMPAATSSGIGEHSTPFSAAHPFVAGRRNSVRSADDVTITLGPAQELLPRQHASGRTVLHAKKRR